MLLPHQLRMLSEKEDLDGKIEKLNNFIDGDVFQNLPREERNDLYLQDGAMKLYALILERRISRFGSAEISND